MTFIRRLAARLGHMLYNLGIRLVHWAQPPEPIAPRPIVVVEVVRRQERPAAKVAGDWRVN